MSHHTPSPQRTRSSCTSQLELELESDVQQRHVPNHDEVDLQIGRRSSVSPPSGSEEPIDPRVQIELENLNTLTDLINKLELELDDSRASFRQVLSDSANRLNTLSKSLGSCVEKARAYYEARMKAKELQNETQKATVRYERAISEHIAAKELVGLAEEGLCEPGRIFDPAWQEMLNHATARVNAAEEERAVSELEHQRTSAAYIEAESLVSQLQSKFKRSIVKARPYYEMKGQFNQLMDEKLQRTKKLEAKVAKAKSDYSLALKRLEGISSEIHEKRKQALERRKQESAADSAAFCRPLSPAIDFRRLNLISSTPNRTGVCTAVVYPWSVKSSTSSYGTMSDCDSESGSQEGLDTLDESTIDKLMLGTQIENHLMSYMTSAVASAAPLDTEVKRTHKRCESL